MPTYIVKVSRCSRVWEEGIHIIEASSAQEAEDLAAEMDDPSEMTRKDESTEIWECNAVEESKT